MHSLVVRLLWRVAGALAILASFFFGTLFILGYSFSSPADLTTPAGRDRVRAENARAVIRALAEYRSIHDTYPVLPDSTLPAVAKPLVTEGFLRAVPRDPPGTEPIHYVSFNGAAFGIWIHFEKSPACIVEIGASKTGWWGQPEPCRL